MHVTANAGKAREDVIKAADRATTNLAERRITPITKGVLAVETVNGDMVQFPIRGFDL